MLGVCLFVVGAVYVSVLIDESDDLGRKPFYILAVEAGMLQNLLLDVRREKCVGFTELGAL